MRAALLSKGFREEKTHHEMLWFYAGDKKTSIRTRFSHGVKEYDDWLCALVRKQMNLRGNEFVRFMECPMGYGEYLDLMKALGHVREEEPPGPPPSKKKRRN